MGAQTAIRRLSPRSPLTDLCSYDQRSRVVAEKEQTALVTSCLGLGPWFNYHGFEPSGNEGMDDGRFGPAFVLWRRCHTTPCGFTASYQNGMVQREREATNRSSADKKAQDMVKGWYSDSCVLCGVCLVTEGAHIIDVVAQQQIQPVSVWRMLKIFWPLEKLAALDMKEERNILPLSPTAHSLWDIHEFGLRPIKHSTDPDHILFLQVVIFKQLHVEIGFSSNRPRGGFSTHLLDPREDPPKHIQHGDVYKLVTTDPEKRPLPRFEYLQVRYAVQTIIAAQKAAGALKTLFGGPPPESTVGLELDDVCVPGEWEEDLDEAVRLGILNYASKMKWRLAILEYEYRKRHALWEEEDVEEQDVEKPWSACLTERPPNSTIQQVRGE